MALVRVPVRRQRLGKYSRKLLLKGQLSVKVFDKKYLANLKFPIFFSYVTDSIKRPKPKKSVKSKPSPIYEEDSSILPTVPMPSGRPMNNNSDDGTQSFNSHLSEENTIRSRSQPNNNERASNFLQTYIRPIVRLIVKLIKVTRKTCAISNFS